MFKINNISAMTHDSSFGGYPFKVCVNVTMNAKEWSKYKKNSQLGVLYGIEISNAVYAIDNAIPAHNPMVDDSKRASKGVKTIILTYHSKDFNRAALLGLEVKTMKSGEQYLGFNTYSKIL